MAETRNAAAAVLEHSTVTTLELPENIEEYRDVLWRRREDLRVETPAAAEAMVEDLGFCLGMTDIRHSLPSIYIAVCGRRDAHMPRNVQKDPEASMAWRLKDAAVMRGKVFYAKLIKGNSMFVSPRLLPYFNAVWGCSKKEEAAALSADARKVLKVLRSEWEMATADLRKEAKIADKKDLTKAIDELQKKLKIIPQEVVYEPKFTYIWTITEARFPAEMAKRCSRETAVAELARCYLKMGGLTGRGELSRRLGLSRREAGKANHQLVDEGFAERLSDGVYRLASLKG